MTPVRSLILAIILSVSGLVKILAHKQAADPFAASWCRSAGQESLGDGFFASVHCWGCYSLAIGIAFVLWAAYSASSLKLESGKTRGRGLT